MNNPNDSYDTIRLISIWGGTITKNQANNNGGGIYTDVLTEIYFSHESITYSPVISENSASNSGGGIYLHTSHNFYFWNGTTITSNISPNGAGIFIATNNLNTSYKGFNGTFYFNNVKIYSNKSEDGSTAVQLTLADYNNDTDYVLTGQTKIEGRVQIANRASFSLGDANWSNTTVIEIEPLGDLLYETSTGIRHRLLRNVDKSIKPTEAPKNKKQYFKTTNGRIIEGTYRFDQYNSCTSLTIVK